MKKTLLASILGLTLAFSSLSFASADTGTNYVNTGATVGINYQATAQLSPMFVSLTNSLNLLSVRLANQLQTINQVSSNLADASLSLRVLATNPLQTPLERAAASSAIANLSSGVNIISQQFAAVKAEWQSEVNILSQLNAQLKVLISLLITQH